MKTYKKMLVFANKQLVRLQWGYAKIQSGIGLLNAVSLLVTALSVSKLVNFTWLSVTGLFIGAMVFLALFMLIMARLGVLQKETQQNFRERTRELWFAQTEFMALQIALKNKFSKEELEVLVDKQKKEMKK